MSDRDEVLEKIVRLGFADADAKILADHFLDAEARGRLGHGLTRVDWLASLPTSAGRAARAGRSPNRASSAGTAAARSAT